MKKYGTAGLVLALLAGGSVAVAQQDEMVRAAIEAQIRPVGQVNIAGAAPAVAAAPKAAMSGADVVKATCGACHLTGAINAPKIGEKGAWEPRLQTAGGIDGLVASAIKGKGAMPPRGGGNYSDEEIRAAIEKMLADSGL